MPEDSQPTDFIRSRIAQEIESNVLKAEDVVTRFPPEPNGFLHIGHAKAITLSFLVAREYGGRCHLRFDDTNPTKEEQRYIDSIKQDIRWLGFDWGEHEYYTSDYFDQLYQWAVLLIKEGKAYVDDQTGEQIRQTRGTLTEPGTPSPCRNRLPEENLKLFEQMAEGQFSDKAHVLRAKIDMASGNLNMRDPVMYRILRATHPRTGDKWCIYPTYDWAHGQSDALENITHSLCTLEFQDHRPLYEWFHQALNLPAPRPEQIEFSRLNLSHMLMSKRKLAALVDENIVAGWDDPRMPTLAGMRRRGYTPQAIGELCRRVGIAKRNQMIEFALLENLVRSDLNARSPRFMGVMDPLKVTITNYEGAGEKVEAVNNPEDESAGTRQVPFSGELYIERGDFMEDPPRKFKRLAPGREIRLRYGYFITCDQVVKDANGQVVELLCSYDSATKGGTSPDGRKPKGTIHWVSAKEAADAEIRIYDHLFTEENPAALDESWRECVNQNSLQVIAKAKIEPAAAAYVGEVPLQFERMGYYMVDLDSVPGKPVFNRTITLKDSWSKMQKSGRG